MRDDLGEIQYERTGNARRLQYRNPFRRSSRLENYSQLFLQRLTILNAQRIAHVIGMCPQFRTANGFAKLTPELLTAHRNGKHAITRMKHAVRYHRREGSPHRLRRSSGTEMRHVVRTHRGDHTVEHGDVNVLTESGSIAILQRHQNAD